MYTLKDYSILNKIYQGTRTEVFTAIRNKDKLHCIIKKFSSDYPSAQDIDRMKHEYEISKTIDSDKIVKVIDLIKYENSYYLVKEDIDGQPFKSYLDKNGALSIDNFLEILFQITEGLETIHEKEVIHNDINPNNMVIHESPLCIKITDFGLSSYMSEDKLDENKTAFVGSLPYMSPEHTGRTSHKIDSRSDLYSLGVVAYEMITGRLPFDYKDPIDLINAHLAKTPLSPAELDVKIPLVISDMILKLLKKGAEHRYQSAIGLLDDIRKCQSQLKKTGTIDYFEPGMGDIKASLNWNHKFYGREEALRRVNETLNRVFQGNTEAILISGVAGVGKSRLIQEARERSRLQNAYFIFGKFDLFQRSRPYSGLVQALSNLVKQVLSERQADLERDQENLRTIVGTNGQILIDMIPEIEILIGPQASLEELTSNEVQNRFLAVLHKFLNYFATAAHPLIICLDDIHCADLSSLKLLEILLSDSKTDHFLLMGSFRSNEIEDDHPLRSMIQHLESTGTILNTIDVLALNLTDVTHLIADIFNMPVHEVTDFARIIYNKTEGNPFFIHEMVRTLYNKKAVHFNHLTKKWVWEADKIKEVCPTDNVISLIINNINALQDPEKSILQIASCIGNIFTVQLLAEVADFPADTVYMIIEKAVKDFLIVQNSNDESSKKSFKFLHDNLQYGIYHSIHEGKRKKIHYKAGKILLHALKNEAESSGSSLFNCLNQLNESLDLIRSKKEKKHIINLELQAGIKAKSCAAYSEAYLYFTSGLRLLEDAPWKDNIPYNLYRELAETAFILGKHEEAEAHFSLLLSRSHNIIEKADIYATNILLYTYVGKHKESTDLAIKALELFDLHLPKGHLAFYNFLVKIRLKLKLSGHDLKKLLKEKGPNNDPAILMITKILSYSLNSYILTRSEYTRFLSYYLILFTLKHGHTAFSSSLLFWSIILRHFGASKLPKGMKKYIEAAKFLEDIYGDQKLMTRNKVQFGFLCSHFCLPFVKSFDLLMNSYHICFENGDILNASYCKYFMLRLVLTMGNPLKELHQMAVNNINFFKVNRDLAFEKNTGLLISFIKSLEEDDNQAFANITLASILEQLPPGPYRSIGKYFYGLKAFYFYTFRNANKALEMVEQWRKYEDFSRGIVNDVDDKLFTILIVCLNYPEMDKDRQKQAYQSMKNEIEFFKTLPDLVAENYLARYFFMMAELARIKNQNDKAFIHYDKAIEQAKIYGYLWIEAMTNERAGELCIQLNKMNLARVYLQEAWFAWSNFGAQAKLNQLSVKYPLLLRSWQMESPNDLVSSDHASSSDAFDMLALVQSLQSISSEMNVDKLLKNILDIMIENAGAETGYYISFSQGKLMIAAKGSNNHDSHLVNEELTAEVLPVSVISYVHRSRKLLIISNAIYDQHYRSDPCVSKHQIKSIICLPVSHQQQLIGILYFENNLIAGTFTASIVKILEILSGQFAVSFENAKLYAATDRFVPRQYLEYLNKRDISDVKIGDYTQKNMSILFCDIRNYTTLSEKLSSKETFGFINEFLGNMEPNIRINNGFIDKYIGDAIMALFPDTAESSLKAAIGMFASLKRFNARLIQESRPPIAIGIGINTGDIMLGMVGNEDRMEGTVIGDEVNISSRIQTLTKTYNTPLLIRDETRKNIANPDRYAMRLIDEIIVKGKTKSIVIWEVYAIDEPEIRQLKSKFLEKFNTAVRCFLNHELATATTFFEEIAHANPEDTVVQYYLSRCNSLSGG